ncbi:hypothetical protein CHY_0721 [Carboxydothermus hydrogenoformans Z-2901]|uniref:Uncharacterized protein n=1 Tax=Carboxydothermus hydrogenoformans (strain ATCC BAA-161 / DSM 6008 / Z-2901) TaxID=246194 RepID=Q3AE59_CARHZ|nr:hypothetical protein CHY_0721 [Carboxydothermus hydrogenoformans Z-2901]
MKTRWKKPAGASVPSAGKNLKRILRKFIKRFWRNKTGFSSRFFCCLVDLPEYKSYNVFEFSAKGMGFNG